MSEEEARKQAEAEVSGDLELTDETAGDVVAGAGRVSTSDIPVTKPIDKPTP
jgi:hypothetical protein